MKIVLLNNYDLRRINDDRQAENNNAPAHHLWGYHLLASHNVDADILPFEHHRLLKNISNRVSAFGDLDQQFRLLGAQKNYDAIYTAQYLATPLLSFLRKLGIVKLPIIAIGYQAPRRKSAFWKFFVRNFIGGNDRILCLSKALADDLIAFGVPASKIDVIHWGVDLRFYDYSENIDHQERYIISPGKSYRDFPALLSAFSGLDCKLTICGAGSIKKNQPGLPIGPNVEIFEKMITWKDYLKLIKNSYALAIPLNIINEKMKNAIGLTALIEAIAFGKPVIMTRNDYVGIDIEKEGIGYWVENGDIEGWRNAVNALLDDPEKTQAMRRRARKLAEEKINIDVFSKKLADTILSVKQ